MGVKYLFTFGYLAEIFYRHLSRSFLDGQLVKMRSLKISQNFRFSVHLQDQVLNLCTRRRVLDVVPRIKNYVLVSFERDTFNFMSYDI